MRSTPYGSTAMCVSSPSAMKPVCPLSFSLNGTLSSGGGGGAGPSSHTSCTGPPSQYSHFAPNELTKHHGPGEPSPGSGLRQWLWPPRLAAG